MSSLPHSSVVIHFHLDYHNRSHFTDMNYPLRERGYSAYVCGVGFSWKQEKCNFFLFPNFRVATANTNLGSAPFHKQKITISFSPLSYQLPFNSQMEEIIPYSGKKPLLFISHNDQFKLEILPISYFGYLFHKLSTFLDAYFMKPARILRKIGYHIFHIPGLPCSSERKYWIDSNCQGTVSSVSRSVDTWESLTNLDFWLLLYQCKDAVVKICVPC